MGMMSCGLDVSRGQGVLGGERQVPDRVQHSGDGQTMLHRILAHSDNITKDFLKGRAVGL